jgi:hypothetical protein
VLDSSPKGRGRMRLRAAHWISKDWRCGVFRASTTPRYHLARPQHAKITGLFALRDSPSRIENFTLITLFIRGPNCTLRFTPILLAAPLLRGGLF